LVLGNLINVLIKSTKSISEEYVETAKSLGLSNGEVISKVIWKSLKPKVYGNLVKIHNQLWIAVIIYEFIGAVNGIGSVYKITFEYNDLFAIISLGIFISLVVLLLNFILKFVVSKLVFWK
jgi:ABC-type nitrate/sulfonate/bicarbonate transport system permease component